MKNLGRLLMERCTRRPDTRIGTVERMSQLDELVDGAARRVAVLSDRGLGPGSRVLVLGPTSYDYLCWWAALQLLGAQAALTNPAYPAPLVAEMCRDLRPDAVLWLGTPASPEVAPGAVSVESGPGPGPALLVDGAPVVADRPATRLPGLDRDELDVAGFMHTSGTTGRPKYCAQSHAYFLRLGALVADRLALTSRDTVFAPLPMSHINPLGYGLVGGLVGGADVIGAERFSASGFWPAVRTNDVTVVVLHAPPVEILKRATAPADAAGHRVRAVFYADLEFLSRFEVPLGLSAYGSTEAGGITHLRTWRQGDEPTGPVPAARVGGSCRADVEWRLSADGEILLRERRPGSLFGGYVRDGAIEPAVDGDGWFATADLGALGPDGELVFLERQSESIRVKGEFVPVGYVERVFAELPAVREVALWHRPGPLDDLELVLYVAASALDLESVRAAAATLPTFMRPVVLRRVAALPRDPVVGKVRRRELGSVPVLEEVAIGCVPVKVP